MKRQLAITAIAATSLLLGGYQKDPEPRPYKTKQPEYLTGSIQSLYQQVVYVLREVRHPTRRARESVEKRSPRNDAYGTS